MPLALQFSPFLALSLLSFFAAGSAFAQEAVTFQPEGVTSDGVGCRFAATANRPQDAFIVASGNQISIIFTQLGSVFRQNRRSGQQQSGCRIVLPASLAAGSFVSQVGETLSYGVVKTTGIAAELRTTSNFARRRPDGQSNPNDLARNFAGSVTTFPATLDLNEPLAAITKPLTRIGRDNQANSPFQRFCIRERVRQVNFLSSISIRVDQQDPNASISISVDGLDLKYMVNTQASPCN